MDKSDSQSNMMDVEIQQDSQIVNGALPDEYRIDRTTQGYSSLVLMLNTSEQVDFMKLKQSNNDLFREVSYITNNDEFQIGKRYDSYEFVIVNLYGIADDDVTDNMNYYQYYSNAPVIAWVVQQDDEDDEPSEIRDVINQINRQSQIFEVSDENENEKQTILDAIQWCKQQVDEKIQNLFVQTQNKKEEEIVKLISQKFQSQDIDQIGMNLQQNEQNDKEFKFQDYARLYLTGVKPKNELCLIEKLSNKYFQLFKLIIKNSDQPQEPQQLKKHDIKINVNNKPGKDQTQITLDAKLGKHSDKAQYNQDIKMQFKLHIEGNAVELVAQLNAQKQLLAEFKVDTENENIVHVCVPNFDSITEDHLKLIKLLQGPEDQNISINISIDEILGNIIKSNDSISNILFKGMSFDFKMKVLANVRSGMFQMLNSGSKYTQELLRLVPIFLLQIGGNIDLKLKSQEQLSACIEPLSVSYLGLFTNFTHKYFDHQKDFGEITKNTDQMNDQYKQYASTIDAIHKIIGLKIQKIEMSVEIPHIDLTLNGSIKTESGLAQALELAIDSKFYQDIATQFKYRI